MPERPSSPLQPTVTAASYQPSTSGGRAGVGATVGGVRSMEIPLSVTLAELPALSTQSPAAVWPAPPLDTVVVTVGVTAPESASVQLHSTSTGVRFQPYAL